VVATVAPVRRHTAPRTGTARKQHALVPYIADRGSLALCGQRFVTVMSRPSVPLLRDDGRP
jgi:hypothetical protein